VIHRNDNKIFNIAHLAENHGPECVMFSTEMYILKPNILSVIKICY